MTKGLSPDSLLLKEAEKMLLVMVHDSGHGGITLDELVAKTGSSHKAIRTTFLREDSDFTATLRWHSMGDIIIPDYLLRALHSKGYTDEQIKDKIYQKITEARGTISEAVAAMLLLEE